MKKSFKKMSKSVIAVGIFFAVILFNSCATDDVNPDATHQDLEKTTKIPNNVTSKSSCDCDVILNLDLDLNNDGLVTADDLVHLQVILNYLDFDYDGCVSPPGKVLTGDDFGMWMANGGQHVPTNFRDFNNDGTINTNDVFYAFIGIVPRFGKISGDNNLCQEDINCLLAYIIGNLDCN